MSNLQLLKPRSQEEDEEQLFLTLANEVFQSQHPNPNHFGCPGHQRLRAAAFHQYDEHSKEVMLHVVKCSPCSEAFGRFCREYRSRQQKRLPWLMKIAALLFVVPGVSLWMWIRHVQTPSNPASMAVASQDFHGQTVPPQPLSKPLEVASAKTENLKLDLASQLVLRGETQAGQAAETPLLLPRKPLNLSLVLPPGNEPGRYELRLNCAQSHLQTSGEAHLSGRTTILEVAIDITGFPAGPGQLGIRQAGWQWSDFTVMLK